MTSLIKSQDIHFFYYNKTRFVYIIPLGLIIKPKDNVFNDFIVRLKNNEIKDNKTDRFFLSMLEKEIALVEKPVYRNLTNDISTIVLNLAGSCNLRCEYCFARVNGKFNFDNMTIEQAKKIINFIVSKNPNVKSFEVCFFGGEPMLMFDTMREIVLSSNNKYPDLTFNYSVTTNGTIISDSIIQFFKEHKFSLMLSFDGPDSISNNRPYRNGASSTVDVYNNIKELNKNQIPTTIRATITSSSKHILETFQYLEELKIPFEFSFAYNSLNKEHNLSNYSNDELSSIEHQLQSVIEFYYGLIATQKRIYCKTIINSIGDLHFKVLNKLVCAAGYSNFTFNADGSIYTCQHFANQNNLSCGNIVNGIDASQLEKFRAPLVDTIDECKECWVRYLCGGCCFAEKYAMTGAINKNIAEKCSLERIKWEKIIVLSQMIREDFPELLSKIKAKYEVCC